MVYSISYTPDAKEILSLMQRFNATVLDCRKALMESQGDVGKAEKILLRLQKHSGSSPIELYK